MTRSEYEDISSSSCMNLTNPLAQTHWLVLRPRVGRTIEEIRASVNVLLQRWQTFDWGRGVDGVWDETRCTKAFDDMLFIAGEDLRSIADIQLASI